MNREPNELFGIQPAWVRPIKEIAFSGQEFATVVSVLFRRDLSFFHVLK